MASHLITTPALICAITGVGLLQSWYRKRNKHHLPPGPRGLPIIGNVLDVSEDLEWERAFKWGEKYGPIVYTENLGIPCIYLNSYQAAVDLLDKNGLNYSSRPRNLVVELEGWTEWSPSLMPYEDELRKSRNILHRFLQPSAVGSYAEIQTQATHKLLERLLDSPDRYFDSIRQMAAEIIMLMTYGHKVSEKDDPFIKIVEQGIAAFVEASGSYLVNVIPWLQYLPSWFPGTSFQRVACKGRKHLQNMIQTPHNMVKKTLMDSASKPCMSAQLMNENMESNGNIKDEALIAKVAGVTYSGGADTTVSVMLTFLLAMVLHPSVQKRAQEELDRVIGRNNLPSLADRENLPYIEAVCKECLRWQPVTPLGFPHAAAEQDEYNGYTIPAGAVIYPNVWAMQRDPSMYAEPEKFIPERWMALEGTEPPPDVYKITFGFGRRICPGRYFAINSIFIGVASILSTFNITKALDENGNPITPKADYTPLIVRHPKPFKCSLTPRSDEIERVVRQAAESVE
ncbi:cytochrome P450 [Fomitiporia mediterranea MF3/22]|uniref:cytochrome P450 n=1 Tax=Fomitiporia mediterranea (strain MF3/22) TaxID=694068 RepID=UPI00044090F5|nr:cytochrome P450 [Fomitiporia mediterranea MF3/22]EJD01808.1 cytochrome P450 [Fomitiporia mediterranea MF3/22]